MCRGQQRAARPRTLSPAVPPPRAVRAQPESCRVAGTSPCPPPAPVIRIPVPYTNEHLSLSQDTITEPAPLADEEFGTFTEAGDYIPRTVVENDLGDMSLDEAIDGTIVEFEDGDLVNGTIVRVDKDEVLLDIGYKSEGVIPAKECRAGSPGGGARQPGQRRRRQSPRCDELRCDRGGWRRLHGTAAVGRDDDAGIRRPGGLPRKIRGKSLAA